MSGLELDVAVIQRRLNHLAKSVKKLEAWQDTSLEQLESDEGVDWTVLHGLQICIQAVLDISAHLIAGSGEAVPDQYRSGISELSRLKILPAEFAERIAAMAGFRNILVHQYLDVDMEIVKHILDDRLDDFEAFGQYIQRYLDQRA